MGLLDMLGFNGPVANYVGQNRNKIHGAFAGFGQGRNFGEGLGKAALGAYEGGPLDDAAQQEAQLQNKQNQTMQWLQEQAKTDPRFAQLAQGVQMGALPIDQAFQMGVGYLNEKPAAASPPTDDMREFEYAQQHPEFNDFLHPPEKGPAAPAGYRFGQDGNLAFIPGGPADPSTAGKTTEATRRNQQLASVIAPELETLIPSDGSPGTFDALANGWDQAKGMIPGNQMMGPLSTSPDYQQAQNSLRTIVASYLYSVSGATANPGEVATQVDILTPKPGESPESVAAKKARVVQMVEAVKAAATGTPINVPGSSQQPGGVVDFTTYFGGQ